MNEVNWIVCKSVIKEVGIIAAVIYSYYAKEAEKENWRGIVKTHKQVAKEFNIKEYTVKKAKDDLIASGYITTAMGGLPYKEYIYINPKGE